MSGLDKVVMVFGVFDLLHPGHLYLLYHARLKGDKLIAVIARDSAVRKLKGIVPNWSQAKRARAVKETGLVDKAVLGDVQEGSYAVIQKHKPDIICLGYDQESLKKNLLANMKSNRLPEIPLYTLKPYKADVFHSSIRRNKNKK